MRSHWAIVATAVLGGALAGCSPEAYRNSADAEVKGVLAEKRGSEERELDLGEFRVEQAPLALEEVGRAGDLEDFSRVPVPKALAGAPLRADAEGRPLPEGGEGAEADGDGSSSGDERGKGKGNGSGDGVGNGNGDGDRDGVGDGDRDGVGDGDRDGDRDGVGDGVGDGDRDGVGNGNEAGAEAGAGAGAGDGKGNGNGDRDANGNENGDGELGGLPGAEPMLAVDSIPGTPRAAARLLTLREALHLAFANSREYQSSRESVYLSALALTLSRYDFSPRFLGVITGGWSQPASGEDSGRIDTNFGMNLLLATGARLSLSVLQNFFQFFAGNREEVARTILSGALTQPLLRGFGPEIVLEPLIQAERNLVYQIRTHHRFQETFSVRVVSQYYRVLQERDRILNEYRNWQSLVENRARVEDLSSAGRIARLEVDQALQQELQAEDRYSAAVEQYEGALDDFKITLGIPIAESIALDPKELDRLIEAGVRPLDLPLEAAVSLSLERRVDARTERGRVEDAERQVRVLADALRAQLDVNADVSLASGERGNEIPTKFNTANLDYGVGFTLDLPLDRKAERNAYVGAIIALERQKRAWSLFDDQVRLTVRDAYRALQREIVSYPIQKASVELAEERVTSTTFLLQAGRASTRDILESQTALINARNALTGSLINYELARLAFFRDAGMLAVDESGQLGVEAIEPEVP